MNDYKDATTAKIEDLQKQLKETKTQLNDKMFEFGQKKDLEGRRNAEALENRIVKDV